MAQLCLSFVARNGSCTCPWIIHELQKHRLFTNSWPNSTAHYKLFSSPNHWAAPACIPSTLLTLAVSAYPQPSIKTQKRVSKRSFGCSFFTVTAVCLTVTLKDGTAGLWEVGRSQNTALQKPQIHSKSVWLTNSWGQLSHSSACTLLTLGSARKFKGASTPVKELKLCQLTFMLVACLFF